jgi:hypothetical protein
MLIEFHCVIIFCDFFAQSKTQLLPQNSARLMSSYQLSQSWSNEKSLILEF